MSISNKLPIPDMKNIEHNDDAEAKNVVMLGITSGGAYIPIKVDTDGSIMAAYLNLSGSNANQDIDIGIYNFTTTGDLTSSTVYSLAIATTNLITENLQADHIGEKTPGHNVVFDNDINLAGNDLFNGGDISAIDITATDINATNIFTDHIGEKTPLNGVVFDNNVVFDKSVTITEILGLESFLTFNTPDIGIIKVYDSYVLFGPQYVEGLRFERTERYRWSLYNPQDLGVEWELGKEGSGFTRIWLKENARIDTMTLSSGSITDTTGTIDFDNENLTTTGKLGIGSNTLPSIAHIYENTANTGATAGLTIENAGSGDAVLHFKLPEVDWSIGADNTGEVFRITKSSALGTSKMFTIDILGNMNINTDGFQGGGKFTTKGKSASDTITDIFDASLDRAVGVGGVGFGLGYNFQLENGAGIRHDAGRFEFVWTDPTATSEESKYVLKTMSDGSFVEPLVVKGNSVLMGDGGTTNYTEIKADGEINLRGTARVLRHLRIGAGSLKLGASSPTAGLTGIFPHLAFSHTVNQEAHYQIIIPHRWDNTIDVEICFDWLYTGGQDNGTVKWGLEYNAKTAGEDPTAGSTTITQTTAGTHTTGQLVRTCITTKILASNLTAEDTMGMRIFRDQANDTLGTSAILLGIHLHFTENKLGGTT